MSSVHPWSGALASGAVVRNSLAAPLVERSAGALRTAGRTTETALDGSDELRHVGRLVGGASVHRVDKPRWSQSALVAIPPDGGERTFQNELALDQLRPHPNCRVKRKLVQIPSLGPLAHGSICLGRDGVEDQV